MTGIKTPARGSWSIGITVVLLSVASGVLAQDQPAKKSKAGASVESAFPAAQSANPPANATLANLAWLEGRWQGTWGPRIIDQTWMAPKAGTMIGVFREVGNDNTLVVELFSLVETSAGIEYRSRHFTPSLAPWETSAPSVLKLTSADPARIVFENALDGKPKRVVFTRTGPDTYTSTSEIASNQGESQVTEITYRRIPSGGSAGRR